MSLDPRLYAVSHDDGPNPNPNTNTNPNTNVNPNPNPNPNPNWRLYAVSHDDGVDRDLDGHVIGVRPVEPLFPPAPPPWDP